MNGTTPSDPAKLVQLRRPAAIPRPLVASPRVGGRAVIVLYVLALVAVVVGIDVLFFRNHFWPRLVVNVGIVLVFGAFCLRFQGALRGK